MTHGAFLPWDVSKVEPPLVLLGGAPKAPLVAAQSYSALQARPIREFPIEEAYAAAIERDTIGGGYGDFLDACPASPLARRRLEIPEPPPRIEYEIIDRPVILFGPEDYPPPPPVYFLPPHPQGTKAAPAPIQAKAPPPQHQPPPKKLAGRSAKTNNATRSNDPGRPAPPGSPRRRLAFGAAVVTL